MTAATVTAAWQKRAVDLLSEAMAQTLPDFYGCCSSDNPCGMHEDWMCVAMLISDIRDAVAGAENPQQAGERVGAVLAGGAR